MKEREVKKVLQKSKPFFSYGLVFNTLRSRLPYSRFAIVISGKSVPNAVVRNSYRRMFYEISGSKQILQNLDVVCVIKSKTKLTRDPASHQKLAKEMHYIFDTKLGKNI